ncbi:hypothetical protein DL764_005266 [Monosporascus ibericus]|uniref:Uncharacterized protein n=1 Tax=Monosporascus ibericus TaxID=155417 RepID=A0A4Q4TDJ5_9PEZI|nr:hypothetical protein DL764_005266 [Monosporascus ibericus]
MPAITESQPVSGAAAQFPPITREHILHCSYDSWFPRYQSACIKSRIIQLTPEFIKYIREDGIVLADDDDDATADDDDDEEWASAPSGVPQSRVQNEDDDTDSDSDSDEDEPPRLPPNQRFPELHQAIKDKIAELGGAVAPKLNWSAPKDATWISPHQNTIKCTTANDIYLLLKSSNFITHDLEHAFDDCIPSPGSGGASPSASSSNAPPSFKPVLVLRSYFNPHTAMEFRCFVKHRNLVAISQRDLNYFDFLKGLRADIVARVAQLFNHRLRFTFPDGSFVFDVYIPEGEDEPLGRAKLIDINPWAPHTDTLLFGWPELLDLEVPSPVLGTASAEDEEEGGSTGSTSGREGEEDEEEEDDDFVPELRLVEEEDHAAYNLSSPQYSAHKLPKDVVDASLAGEGGMREFAEKWREMVEYRSNIANWEMDDKD